MSDGEDAVKKSENLAGSKITESFKGLSTTLETLQTHAVQQEEGQQDQIKKRQRTTPPDKLSAERPEAPRTHFGEAE